LNDCSSERLRPFASELLEDVIFREERGFVLKLLGVFLHFVLSIFSGLDSCFNFVDEIFNSLASLQGWNYVLLEEGV